MAVPQERRNGGRRANPWVGSSAWRADPLHVPATQEAGPSWLWLQRALPQATRPPPSRGSPPLTPPSGSPPPTAAQASGEVAPRARREGWHAGGAGPRESTAVRALPAPECQAPTPERTLQPGGEWTGPCARWVDKWGEGGLPTRPRPGFALQETVPALLPRLDIGPQVHAGLGSRMFVSAQCIPLGISSVAETFRWGI